MNFKLNHKIKINESARSGATGYPMEQEARRKTLLDALQYPATLLPLAVGISSTAFWLLISPMFGGEPAAISLAGFSFAVAAVSFVYRNARAYPENLRQTVEYLEKMLLQQEDEERMQAYARLQTGFASTGSIRGSEVLAELKVAYQQLAESLAQRRVTDPLSLAAIPALAEEAHRRGLNILLDALDLIKSAQALRNKSPGAETSGTKMDSNAGREAWFERRELTEGDGYSSIERLETSGQFQIHVDQLIQQAGRCAAVLLATRIELASIRAGGTKTSVDAVVKSLEATLGQVKEIQAELERMDL